MGKHTVTQGQWKAVMGEDKNASVFDGTNKYNSSSADYIPATPTFNRDNLPVERVSWYDALVFANKLSVKDGLQPAYRIKNSNDPAQWGEVPRTANDKDWDKVEVVDGANGWRLPSEHQWEFAAKGGTKSAGYKGESTDTYFVYSGSNEDTLGDFAVYKDNSDDRTHEVGKRKPNELGLYDMSGNVREWCYDTYYPDNSTERVYRGGCWDNLSLHVRSAFRSYYNPGLRFNFLGFRLVRP